jgi:hypothetical protein
MLGKCTRVPHSLSQSKPKTILPLPSLTLGCFRSCPSKPTRSNLSIHVKCCRCRWVLATTPPTDTAVSTRIPVLWSVYVFMLCVPFAWLLRLHEGGGVRMESQSGSTAWAGHRPGEPRRLSEQPRAPAAEVLPNHPTTRERTRSVHAHTPHTHTAHTARAMHHAPAEVRPTAVAAADRPIAAEVRPSRPAAEVRLPIHPAAAGRPTAAVGRPIAAEARRPSRPAAAAGRPTVAEDRPSRPAAAAGVHPNHL